MRRRRLSNDLQANNGEQSGDSRREMTQKRLAPDGHFPAADAARLAREFLPLTGG
jgi:hypothetical protein